MPYVPKESRAVFEDALLAVSENIIRARGMSRGELNYVISSICDLYAQRHGASYTALSDVIGALECAKLEYYRRQVAPYEDTKLNQNGDVYATTHELPSS